MLSMFHTPALDPSTDPHETCRCHSAAPCCLFYPQGGISAKFQPGFQLPSEEWNVGCNLQKQRKHFLGRAFPLLENLFNSRHRLSFAWNSIPLEAWQPFFFHGLIVTSFYFSMRPRRLCPPKKLRFSVVRYHSCLFFLSWCCSHPIGCLYFRTSVLYCLWLTTLLKWCDWITK